MQTILALISVAGCVATADAGTEGLKRFEYQQSLMGVPVRIVVYAAGEAPAKDAVHHAFDRIRELNLIFSDYDDESEISRLCRTSGPGRPVRISPDLDCVLADALEVARRSEGAFDVSVGPLVNLWRKARRTRRLPSPQALQAARRRVGYQWIHLDEQRRTVELLRRDMRLDFGGIVKGYAADEARAALAARGIKRALVALSGDISAGEPPPGEPGWKIGVQGFAADQAPLEEFLVLRNMAVSTAGDTYQFVEIDGKRYSHLIDPKTGLGITRRISVTVVAPRGITSDGLDSAAAILGPEKGLKLLEGMPGVSGRIVELTSRGPKRYETRGFAKYLAPSATAPKSLAAPNFTTGRSKVHE